MKATAQEFGVYYTTISRVIKEHDYKNHDLNITLKDLTL